MHAIQDTSIFHIYRTIHAFVFDLAICMLSYGGFPQLDWVALGHATGVSNPVMDQTPWSMESPLVWRDSICAACSFSNYEHIFQHRQRQFPSTCPPRGHNMPFGIVLCLLHVILTRFLHLSFHLAYYQTRGSRTPTP